MLLEIILKLKEILLSTLIGGSTEVTFDRMLKNNDIDIVVVMTLTNKKTGEPGITFKRKSLEHGVNVVTSDKGSILLAYKKLN